MCSGIPCGDDAFNNGGVRSVMELLQRIEEALKEAMREKDQDKRDALRSLLTSMKNREKELRRVPDEAEIRQLIASQVKQRRDSIEQYSKAGRQDLVDKEEREVKVLQAFLPQQLTLEELDVLIESVLQEVGAVSSKDMGKVMKALMPRLGGRAEGKMVNERVRAKLPA